MFLTIKLCTHAKVNSLKYNYLYKNGFDKTHTTNQPTLLHSLEQAAGDIGLYMNANKTELMSFKQKESDSFQVTNF